MSFTWWSYAQFQKPCGTVWPTDCGAQYGAQILTRSGFEWHALAQSAKMGKGGGDDPKPLRGSAFGTEWRDLARLGADWHGVHPQGLEPWTR